jgi:hypothetical protein
MPQPPNAWPALPVAQQTPHDLVGGEGPDGQRERRHVDVLFCHSSVYRLHLLIWRGFMQVELCGTKLTQRIVERSWISNGHTYPRATKRSNEFGEVKEYEAGNHREKPGSHDGLSVSLAPFDTTGMPRSGFHQSSQSDLCAWLLLAPASGLFPMQAAKVESSVLAVQTGIEPGTRCQEQPQVTGPWLENYGDMGMSG